MNPIPDIETRPLAHIRQFQFLKLKETITYIEQFAPFYKRLFSQNNIGVSDVSSWEDFVTLPTTTKDDIQKYNWDFLCVPRNQIKEYTSTSGTLGKPVTIGLTAQDVKRLAYNECLSFACADGSSQDLYQLMLTLDRQFMAGIAYYEGIRQLGAGLIRVGPGLPPMQWETIERLKPTAVVAVPSFLVKLIEYAKQVGIDLNQSGIKKAICIGESIRSNDFSLNAMGKKIVQAWDIKLFSTYASTEMQTAFTECNKGKGGHLHPELIYIEILDENNIPVKPGDLGEVVITTLGVQGMPLLRYKTGDKAQLFEEPCSCGRTTARLGPVVGRHQQMIKLKGTTLYPPAIFETLHQVAGIKDYVVEVFTDELKSDVLKIFLFVDEIHQQEIMEKLRSVFQSGIHVVPLIEFLSQPAIEQLQTGGGGRKIKKFIDRRTL